MGLSLQTIEAMAPDQASLDAARKLLKPPVWPTLAADGAGLAWGEAQGSGATPYRVVISEDDAGFKCTCPSRKFPCKHSLALMWMRAEGKVAFAAGTPPDWVSDWLGRRRGGNGGGMAGAAPRASIAATEVAEEPTPADPKAEARAAALRDRNREAREAGVLAGLDELDLWLSDQVERGMISFASNAVVSCRNMARRLVDAKASGLASRLESLPARLFALPDAARAVAAVEELGQLHLIAEAYRRQAELDSAVRDDVRQVVGWSLTREQLLQDPSALRLSGRWHVVASRSEVQPDRLRRLESWLWREAAPGNDGDGPQMALLMDFVPVTAGAGSVGYAVGARFEADLVFYPSPAPVRALIAQQTSSTATSDHLPPLPDGGLAVAWAGYELAIARRPWLDVWPLAYRRAMVRRAGDALWLVDGDAADFALPLTPDQSLAALPLTNVGAIDGIGLWDGRHLRLSLAATDLGRWVDT